MSKIQVDAIEQQTACGTTLTAGGGAGKTVVLDATTVTLGRCGGTVALASGASQTGFGRTGTVDWQTTPKTATFTAVSGEGYFANTTGSAFNMNLPAGVAGAIVSVADYAATFQTTNLTVVPNGTDKIGSLNLNATLNIEGQSVTFVYVDSTQGWINTMDSTSNVRGNPLFVTATGGSITTSGNCKIHTFTGPGTFAVSQIATCAANNIMSHVVLAGGGGGGVDRGGGGGAGGYREVKNPATPYTASALDGYPSAANRVTVTATSFPITVGGGGAIGVPMSGSGGPGGNGNPSVFSGITSTGGGGGKTSNSPQGAGNGGSGGGGAGSGSTTAGTGNTPPVSPPQGNKGGDSADGSPFASGAGGGGAGAAAANANLPSGASPAGGAGVSSSITGSPVTRGGGGGATGKNPNAASAGGSGGGGTAETSSNGAAGTANTGGGGGSSCTALGGLGGSGIVIIRYKFQ